MALSAIATGIPLSMQIANDGTFSAQTAKALWLDGWGLLGLNADIADAETYAAVFCVKSNGKVCRIGLRDGWDGIGWSAANNRLVLSGDGLNRDWHECTYPALGQVGALNAFGDHKTFGVLSNRVIKCTDGYRIYSGAYGVNPATLEYTKAVAGGTGTGGLWYAGQVEGKDHWWVFSVGNGRLWKYNSTDLTIVANSETSVGSGFVAGGYSIELGLFFIVRTGAPQTLSIYSLEPVASALSAPALSSAVAKGGTRTLTTVVTGDLGEKCAGRNVTFTTTHGTVDPVTVATDATGTATTTFHAPSTTVVGGTLTAELVE